MATRRRVGRLSLADQMRANDEAHRAWGAAFGKEPNPAWLSNQAPKRTRAPSGKPLERDILKAIMDLLRRHPKVAHVWRCNSGVFKEGDRYIRANSARGMSDIMGILRDGRTIAIEVKTPTGVVQAHQHEFLNSIATAGGVAFVARSVDDVITKLGELK